MKKQNDEYLCKTYPEMMVNRNKDMKETCMCWGFECGDGWFPLIETLMGNIQSHIDWQNKEKQNVHQVTLDQVKEKFGTLRFYYSGGDERIDGMVSLAESLSGRICEGCGNLGSMRGDCESCRNVRQK
jgi:hypothetical protein